MMINGDADYTSSVPQLEEHRQREQPILEFLRKQREHILFLSQNIKLLNKTKRCATILDFSRRRRVALND